MNEIMNYQSDPRGMSTATKGATTEMMMTRQAQEVQAAIVIAKRFPRNYVESYNRVLEACKRRKLAENAVYEYPRGMEKVTGPSIRLAESLAQNWGNIDFGITELEQRDGESQVMAYAWDLETNTRQTKIFTVKHVRHTKKGDYKLTDPRDIYELVANNGARRLRACILGVIPGDVVDAAMEQCNKTLASANGGAPLVDTIRAMAAAFKNEYGVTLTMLEKYIGWKSESFSAQDVVKLRRVYTSLRDGMTKKEDVFDMNASADDGTPIDAFANAPQGAAQGATQGETPAQGQEPATTKKNGAQAGNSRAQRKNQPVDAAPAQDEDYSDEFEQFDTQYIENND